MNMRRTLTTFLFGALLLSPTGCNQLNKRVVFATKTQLGLDVSGTAQVPDKVSFTYGRFEGAIVPRSINGDAYSVYGGLDADVNFFGDQTIKQVFATGDAAIIAADSSKTNATDANLEGKKGEKKKNKEKPSTRSLFFVTDTAYGLKLSAGKQDISPTLMMGFKRVEGAIIPVDKTEKEVRSVYADLSINTRQRSTNNEGTAISFPNNKGVRIIQGFATGKAADLRATDANVKKALQTVSSPSAFKAGTSVPIDTNAVALVAKHFASKPANSPERKAEFDKGFKRPLKPQPGEYDGHFKDKSEKEMEERLETQWKLQIETIKKNLGI